MITVSITFDRAGALVLCDVEGHAGAAASGSDIVCAAVSVLVRAFARTLQDRAGIKARFDVSKRGFFHFDAEYEEDARIYLTVAGTFLFEGLSSVAEEYPSKIQMFLH